jgi:hypothetical protein
MTWSPWRPFPDPRKQGILHAPLGPGVYQFRHRSTKAPVLFGISRCCAARLSTLLPNAKGGTGGRNNSPKREYVARHLADIEYRTLATKTRADAEAEERKIKQGCAAYRFRI